LNIVFNKSFLKDLSKIPPEFRENIERFSFVETMAASSFNELRFEKLHGYKIFYKKRFGVYRVGVSYSADTLTFLRVIHRKDIYKVFP
jgi:mRNA interferase RelE/StbE